MNTKFLFGLYVLLAVVQMAVPLGQIRKHEDILKTGAVYNFRTAPVDPYDAFRGRYVALSYADTVAAVRKGEKLESQAPAYVSLSRGADGFAQFGELSFEPPAGCDYLRVQYLYEDDKANGTGHFRLPYDRFFMEETQAPLAEEVYRKHHGRDGQSDRAAYVGVRVKDGRGVIEDLYIDNKPIREFLREEGAQKNP